MLGQLADSVWEAQLVRAQQGKRMFLGEVDVEHKPKAADSKERIHVCLNVVM